MKILRLAIFVSLLFCSFGFINFKETPKGNLVIHFKNYVEDKVMKLDSASYKNEAGQAFTVTNFKYYISNIHLYKKDGTDYRCENYFLIKEDDEQSKQLNLNDVPEGEYTSISFVIGVDSLHNCSGAQSGALDIVNAMFWTWNSGYIFMKLEGKSSASKSPGGIFEFHIGGYKPPANCIRSVNLKVDKLVISSTQSSSLSIKTDASEIMKTPKTIDLSILSSVTDYHNAEMIANNYTDMFSIILSK